MKDVKTDYTFDPLDPSRLLCVVIRASAIHESDEDGVRGTRFLTPPELPLQVALIGHDAGDTVPPHRHEPHERKLTGTPEALLVISGSYRMTVFDDFGVDVGSTTVKAGDIVVAVGGGHGFAALEDDSGMYEVKVGPYMGPLDKVRL